MTSNHRSVALLTALKNLTDLGHEIVEVDFATGSVRLFLNVEVRDERLDQVIRAYHVNKSKIDAIKEYRMLFGTCLADSKNAVEKLMIDNGVPYATVYPNR